MKSPVVIVDDEPRIRSTLAGLLNDEGYAVISFESGEEGLKYLESSHADVLFLDVMLPGMNGLDVMSRVKRIQPGLRILMMSGQANINLAVTAVKSGAYSFFEKPLNPDQIIISLKHIAEQVDLERKMATLENQIDEQYVIVGESPPVQKLRKEIETAGPSEGRVLIFGENGTGKELVARSIHYASGRRGTFVSLNCAALPQPLVESELFGFEKGAFTGAFKSKPGRFELADGGTLFLDEVGDMDLETQAKLLRVLEERESVRLGGSKPYAFDARVISATNKDLIREIEEKRFREDLYYRLNVIPVTCPPLRERQSDIVLLASHFLHRLCKESCKELKSWGEHALDHLLTYNWPGNVRELKNFVERLVIMVSGTTIHEGDVLDYLPKSSHRAVAVKPKSDLSFRDHVEQFEREILQERYNRYNGNVSEMARNLKMDRSNLHRKLKQYRIK